MNIKISLVIPVYNRQDLVRETIESCLSQSIPIDEIIVVDNNSSDDSYKIALEYSRKYKNIFAFKNKKNVGMIENWNIGIKLCHNQYISILHSDDLIPQNWCETIKYKINKSVNNKLNVKVYFGSASKIIKINEKIKPFLIMAPFNEDMLLYPSNSVKLLWSNFFVNINNSGAIIYDRDIFSEVGYFNSKMGLEADQDLHIRILNQSKVLYVNSNLVYYRYHDNQASFNRCPYTKKNAIISTIKVIQNSILIQKRLIKDQGLIQSYYCYVLTYGLLLFFTLNFKLSFRLLSNSELYNIRTITSLPFYLFGEMVRRIRST